MKFDFNKALNEGFDFQDVEDESTSFAADNDIIQHILYKDPEKYYDLEEDSMYAVTQHVMKLIDDDIENALILVGKNCTFDHVDSEHNGGSDSSVSLEVSNYSDLMEGQEFEEFRKNRSAMALAWMLSYSEDWDITLEGDASVHAEEYDYDTGYGGGVEIDSIDLNCLRIKEYNSSGRDVYEFYFINPLKTYKHTYSEQDKRLHPEWQTTPPKIKYKEIHDAFYDEYEAYAENLTYEVEEYEPDYDDYRDCFD